MLYVILIFGAMFLLVASVGLLLFYREAMLQRIHEVINPRTEPKSLLSTIQSTGLSLGGLVERLEHLLPKSKAEVSVVQLRMTRAGYRKESAIGVFYGCKVLAPMVLCAVAFFSGLVHEGAFFVYATCLAVGFLAPDFWLGKRIAARQRRIRRGLPDVLDLLVICVEAGLSLDQATARTARELNNALPDLCDELNMVVLEQRAGRARADAWKKMVERTDEESVRNMVSMLVQSEQLGTSVAQDTARAFRHAAHATHSASRGTSRQDLGQAGFSAGVLYFSGAIPGHLGTSSHHHDGVVFKIDQITERERREKWPAH